MKLYVGRDGSGTAGLYFLSRKPFYSDSGVLCSDDAKGEVVVCPAVWHRLGGTCLTSGESRCIDLTLTIKLIEEGA